MEVFQRLVKAIASIFGCEKSEKNQLNESLDDKKSNGNKSVIKPLEKVSFEKSRLRTASQNDKVKDMIENMKNITVKENQASRRADAGDTSLVNVFGYFQTKVKDLINLDENISLTSTETNLSNDLDKFGMKENKSYFGEFWKKIQEVERSISENFLNLDINNNDNNNPFSKEKESADEDNIQFSKKEKSSIIPTLENLRSSIRRNSIEARTSLIKAKKNVKIMFDRRVRWHHDVMIKERKDQKYCSSTRNKKLPRVEEEEDESSDSVSSDSVEVDDKKLQRSGNHRGASRKRVRGRGIKSRAASSNRGRGRGRGRRRNQSRSRKR